MSQDATEIENTNVSGVFMNLDGYILTNLRFAWSSKSAHDSFSRFFDVDEFDEAYH